MDVVERFRRARSDPALVVVEGFHALKHAVRFGADVLEVAVREGGTADQLARELAPDVARALVEALAVTPEVYERLAPRAHPTGVVALARRPVGQFTPLGPGPVVVLEDPRRAENLGAVVRVAAAAGAAGVVALGGADPWHPAAVRGAAGLQFALPVARVSSLDEVPAGRTESARLLVALHPDGEMLRPGAIPPSALLAFGTERRGLSDEVLARADRRLAIPMREGVSSLNLATAVAVALYVSRFDGS